MARPLLLGRNSGDRGDSGGESGCEDNDDGTDGEVVTERLRDFEVGRVCFDGRFDIDGDDGGGGCIADQSTSTASTTSSIP